MNLAGGAIPGGAGERRARTSGKEQAAEGPVSISEDDLMCEPALVGLVTYDVTGGLFFRSQ